AARMLMSVVAPGLARRRPKALGVLEFAGSWAGVYLLRRGLYLPSELSKILDPDLVREGMRRLQPLRSISKQLEPDPGSDIGRICLLESANYLRNQLLRDADWAGMAHGVEIRVPFVDARLFQTLAGSMANLVPGAGKLALA